MSPVYNYARYQVLALAEIEDPRTVMGQNRLREGASHMRRQQTRTVLIVYTNRE